MVTIKLIFWLSVFIVAYCYLFYGALIWFILKLRKLLFKKNKFFFDESYMPEVTLLVAIYNEESVIREKILNSLKLEYPEDKLKIVFITDGSSDSTNEIIAEYPRVRLLYQPARKGKIAAINRAMQFITTPVVVFCDANTFLNKECIHEIAKHYADPKTGGVSGEKIVREPGNEQSLAGAGEGLYWKYESYLKKLDSDFYTVVGAAGELFSIRTNLFEHVPENVLLDDFIISLRIAQKGYRIMYEPKAYAVESPSSDINEEQKRKIRIGAGGYQSIVMLKSLLNIFKYPKLSFQYISHRVLRWAVCPFLLPVIFILNVIIYVNGQDKVFGILLFLQVLFYIAAIFGYLLAIRNKKSKLFYVPYYFVFMNVSLYFGLIRYWKKSQSVLWEKAKRRPEKSPIL